MRMLSKSSDVLKYIIACSFAFFLNAVTVAQQDQSLQHWLSVVEKSPDNAIAWFNIGVLYETGQDTQKNLTQAHDAYQKAIALDYPPAMYNLGSIYAKQKDYANARLWWEKAAELDLPEAQYNMGMLYEKGWGVTIDPQLSSSWYQRAAETAMEKYFQLYQKSRSEHSNSSIADEVSLSVFDRLVFINTASAASSDSYVSAAELEKSASLQLAQADTTSNIDNSNGGEQDRPPDWDWIYSQPQENFTIQLFATKDPEKTGKFIQQYALSEGAKVIQAVVKGTTYYKVLIGSFSEWNDAAVEIGTFPQDLRNQRPWVRKFGSLYKELPKGTVVEQNNQPESEQAQTAEKNIVNTESADSNASQNTETSSQTSETDKAASQNQATIEQNSGVVESLNTQTEKVVPKTTQSAESTDTKDEEKRPEEESPLQAESNNLDVQTPLSTQVETAEEKNTASLELPQTDEVFTIYTKKQLASDGISVELKNQLKSGLEAIQAGDHKSGYSLLTNLAESGLAEAQYRVALLYLQGNGVEKDDVKAFDLMKSASEQGHPYAQQLLADFYVNGTGVDANSSLATYWQQTATDNVNKLKNQ